MFLGFCLFELTHVKRSIYSGVGLLLLVGILSSMVLPVFAVEDVSGPFQPYTPPVAPTKPAAETLKETGEKVKNFFKTKPVEPSTSTTTPVEPATETTKPIPPTNVPVKPPAIAVPVAPANLGDIQELTPALENAPLPVLKKVDDPKNPLGLMMAKNQLNHIEMLMSGNHWLEADKELTTLKPWLIEATERHIELYKILSRVPSGRVQGEFEKRLALEFAKMRDKALFDSGKIAIQVGQPKRAVRDLIEVVQSQSRTDMGVKAYKLLQEIGFTEELQLIETPQKPIAAPIAP
jgi:hypothetical protein